MPTHTHAHSLRPLDLDIYKVKSENVTVGRVLLLKMRLDTHEVYSWKD